MLKKLVLRTLVFGWLVLSAGPAWAGEPPVVTGDPAWDAFAETKKQWMLQLYDLVLDIRPDLKDAADLALHVRARRVPTMCRPFAGCSTVIRGVGARIGRNRLSPHSHVLRP